MPPQQCCSKSHKVSTTSKIRYALRTSFGVSTIYIFPSTLCMGGIPATFDRIYYIVQQQTPLLRNDIPVHGIAIDSTTTYYCYTTTAACSRLYVFHNNTTPATVYYYNIMLSHYHYVRYYFYCYYRFMAYPLPCCSAMIGCKCPLIIPGRHCRLPG